MPSERPGRYVFEIGGQMIRGADKTETTPVGGATQPLDYGKLPTQRRRSILLLSLAGALLVTAYSVFVLTPEPRSRPQANRIKCASNLKQIGLSLQIYMHDFGNR